MEVVENKTIEEDKVFTCTSCGLSENYDYKGKQPPFSKLINFTNDCYVMKDPFSPLNKGQFLILGSDCELCCKPYCQSTECSLFYVKFYCYTCAKQNIQKFPVQVQSRLLKPKK